MKNTAGSTSFDFLCSAEWHLSRSGSMYAAVVYGFALMLSKTTGRFYPSIPKLALYFNADDRAVRKAIHKLERNGFFVKLKAIPGQPISYRPVPHKEWAQNNPNCCLDKVAMTWADEEKDSLAIWLHSASDGTMKCFPNFMRGIRNLGHPEAAIRELFMEFYVNDEATQKGRFSRFMKFLRERPSVERAAEVQRVI